MRGINEMYEAMSFTKFTTLSDERLSCVNGGNKPGDLVNAALGGAATGASVGAWGGAKLGARLGMRLGPLGAVGGALAGAGIGYYFEVNHN